MQSINYSLGTDFDVKPEQGFTLESLASAISTIDNTLQALINNFKSIHQEHTDLEGFVKPALTQGEELIKLMAGRVGAKPKYLNAHFDSPSIWSTIGLLSAEVVSISNKIFSYVTESDQKISATATQASVTYAEPHIQKLGERMDKISQSVRLMNDSIERVMDEQEAQSEETKEPRKKRSSHKDKDRDFHDSSSSSSSDSDSSVDSGFAENSRFQQVFAQNSSTSELPRASHRVSNMSDNDRLARLEAEMQTLKYLKDGTSVNFCSLGFKSLKESNAWLLTHSPGKEFGLVVDAHIVFEHSYALIFGKDSTLSNLHDLARIKLKTDIEGISVTSFEQAVPKLFSKAAI